MSIVFEEVIAEAVEEPETVPRSEPQERTRANPEEKLRTFRRLQARVQQRAARLCSD